MFAITQIFSKSIESTYLYLKYVHFFFIPTASAAITPDQTPTIFQMTDYYSPLTSLMCLESIPTQQPGWPVWNTKLSISVPILNILAAPDCPID